MIRSITHRKRAFAAAALTAFAAGAALLAPPTIGQSSDTPAEDADAAQKYFAAVADDPAARLQKKLDSGEATLTWDPKTGYLRSVLKALNISPASQVLVFSKTSLQRDHISPKTPRALYFNDACYVGFVQNGDVLEISAADPRWGGMFYTIAQRKTAKPRIAKRTFDCLQCHQSPMTNSVPGHMVRSVYVRADGNPELSEGSFLTTHESPMAQRWGGWYVTGTHGGQRHMGNVIARGGTGSVTLDTEKGANVTQLAKFVNTAPYLTPHSDIAALMVLEHQVEAHNRITRLAFSTLDALRDEKRMNAAEGKPLDSRRASTESRLKSAGEPLVQALLFSGEAPLLEPIAGTSGFDKQFAAVGPRDKQGRSLRDLDLKTRLLRHPCSYLIYSEAFDGLPDAAKEFVYRRLSEVLSGRDTGGDKYAHLSADDRKAVLEILLDTKPDFAAAYRAMKE